jgi:putative ABC transport system substrate-binding protein
MRRRKFLVLLGGTAAAWPLAETAQASTTPFIGFLSSRSPSESSGVIAAFRQGLGESGFVEGQNLAIAFRWAEGHYDRLQALAAELVNLNVTVLFAAGGPPSAVAAKTATTTIPIVFSAVNDPVQLGLITSLNRPSGNLTGMSMFTAEVAAKSVELLKELVPTAVTVAYLVNPTNPYPRWVVGIEGDFDFTNTGYSFCRQTDTESAACFDDRRGFETIGSTTDWVATARGRVGMTWSNTTQLQDHALAISADSLFSSHLQELAGLALRRAVPAAYQFREFAAAGGLFSYGASLTNTFRLAGNYTGRILKGENVGDLPVQEATKVELTINLKTAKALGLTVPLPLLGRADEVIE